MDMKTKLEIANSDSHFVEENSDWIGTRIRKNDRLGLITKDMNGAQRLLTVVFDDGKQEVITLNNVGADPAEVSLYEWFAGKGGWLQF